MKKIAKQSVQEEMNTCSSISISLLISCSFQCNSATNNLKTLMQLLIILSKCQKSHSDHQRHNVVLCLTCNHDGLGVAAQAVLQQPG